MPKPKANPYKRTLFALIPRKMFVYLTIAFVLGSCLINLDNRADGSDSNIYFILWFLAVVNGGYSIGFRFAELMGKPVLYTLPRQPIIFRNLIFATSLVVSGLFYLINMISPYSHWIPPESTLVWTPFVFGAGLFVMIAVPSMFQPIRMSLVVAALDIVVAFGSARYFEGTAEDIHRPASVVWIMLAVVSLLGFVWLWVFLSTPNWKRMLLGQSFRQSTLHPESLFQGDMAKDFSRKPFGKRLLKQIGAQKHPPQRAYFRFLYTNLSAVNVKQYILYWVIGLSITMLFALNMETPVIIYLGASVLITLQGQTIFIRPVQFLPISSQEIKWGWFFAMSFHFFQYIFVAALIHTICKLSQIEPTLFQWSMGGHLAMLTFLGFFMSLFHVKRNLGTISALLISIGVASQALPHLGSFLQKSILLGMIVVLASWLYLWTIGTVLSLKIGK